MEDGHEVEQIVRNILSSRKYKNLYEPTVRRVTASCFAKYGGKKAEEEARNELHRIWGSYYGIRPDFHKLFRRFKDGLADSGDAKTSILPILNRQSSTKERIPILDDFYRKIFAITGIPKTIIDHGCGLNPLTYFWMGLKDDSRYSARDIDAEETDFINAVMAETGKSSQVSARTGDILEDSPEKADVAFMLKLIPPIEQQEKGAALPTIKKQDSPFVVVSFPVASISGGKRGMAEFYEKQFEEIVSGEPWKNSKIIFPTELVFVIDKTASSR
jgi:16S rRNA (guanine(1405)-N(7))-methyltransferase